MIYRNDNPLAAFDLAQHLLDCIRPYIDTTSSGPPNRACVHTGEIAWDDCECGQLIVSLVEQFESDTFPEPANAAANGGTRKCGAGLFVYHYRVSMLRCAPVGGDNGEPPPCEAVTEAARVAIEDAWAVRAGLFCCLCRGVERDPDSGIKLFDRYLVMPQIMEGPEGACQGSVVDLFIGVPNGGYPCDVS